MKIRLLLVPGEAGVVRHGDDRGRITLARVLPLSEPLTELLHDEGGVVCSGVRELSRLLLDVAEKRVLKPAVGMDQP